MAASDSVEDVVRYEVDGPVISVVLNRPTKLNAIDGACLSALRSVFARIESGPATRAVVIRAEGKVFCAGADLSYVRQQLISADRYASFLADWHQVFDLIASCTRPTIGAVQGLALAGGFELTQVCDFVIAAEDARFGDQHAKFGLFPGGGSTQRLPRLIGPRRAKWMTMSGEWIDAPTALEWGLVNWIVPATELTERAVEVAHRQALLSLAASRQIKAAIMRGMDLELEEALALERKLAVEHMLGEDATRGLRAFESRTEPVFEGLEPR